jgi:hypothetical protein
VLTANLASFPTGRVQPQDLDDLLFRKPASLHRPLLSSGGLYTSKWRSFRGSEHNDAITLVGVHPNQLTQGNFTSI